MQKSIHNPIYIRLIKRIVAARKELSWTQARAARHIGVTRHWLGKIERREHRLDVLQLHQICRAYDIDITELICQLDEEPAD